MSSRDHWSGQTIRDIGLPHGVIVAAIQRDKKIIVPRGDVVLETDDILVLGASSFEEEKQIDLKELVLGKRNQWNGKKIRDLDISRQTLIIMIKRGNKSLIPNGDLVLMEGDKLIMYTERHVSHAQKIQI